MLIQGTTKRTPLELHEQEKPHLIALPMVRFDTAQVIYRIVDSEGFIKGFSKFRIRIIW